MNTKRFTIGISTVVMLVVLRLALGWHFLYEGIWKIRHPDLFVGETEGFLSGARGPMAGFFNGMLHDIDGHQRLEGNLTEVDSQEKGADGKPLKVLKLAKTWDDLRRQFVEFYRPKDGPDENKKLHEQLTQEAEKVYQRHVQGLNEFVKENGAKIKAHFESLTRYEEGRKSDPHTMFQTQRRWDEMQELRKEAKGWIADLDSRGNALKGDLLGLLRKQRKSEVEAVALADREAAAKAAEVKKAEAEAKKPAATETKKLIETETKKPAKVEAKKPELAKTAAKPPSDMKKPVSVKPKAPAEEKPSDPPKEPCPPPPAKVKAKPVSMETSESGSEESADAEENRTAAKESKEVKKDEKKTTAEGTKPKAATKSKEKSANHTASAADPTLVVVDFSPLADGRPENGPFAHSRNPFSWTRTEQLAFLLTWSLFGIGLCLMLGLFTRPAALAGAGFMLFVVMSQPSFPGVYPLDPPQLGHALLVNKDFVEMIALLVIASTRLGRWTGLDFFVHNCLIKPFCSRCCKSSTTEGEKA